jgi:hypothetical protein
MYSHALNYVRLCIKLRIVVAARSKGVSLRPLASWDCGFGSHMQLGCMSVVGVVCYQAEISECGWSLVQRSLNECSASEYDREASKMRIPLPKRGCCAMKKKCTKSDHTPQKLVNSVHTHTHTNTNTKTHKHTHKHKHDDVVKFASFKKWRRACKQVTGISHSIHSWMATQF